MAARLVIRQTFVVTTNHNLQRYGLRRLITYNKKIIVIFKKILI